MYKTIIFIIISGFILFFSIQDYGYMFLSIPIFLTISYNLSDFFLRVSNNNNIKKNKNIEFLAFVGVISVLFTLRDFEQTIGGYILFWELAFFSLTFSLICTLILNKYFNFNNKKRFYNILSICICFFFLIPNLGVFINKYFSNEKENKQIIPINYKKEIGHSRGSSSYAIFIKTEFDPDERLDVKEEFYNSITNNQIIVLTLKKGILRYNYVSKIEKK